MGEYIVPIVIAVIGTGGFAGMVVALLKVRPEAGQIAVDASQGAVIVQTGVIDTLKDELTRQGQRHNRERKRLEDANTRLFRRLENLESEVEECNKMRSRIEDLERALTDHKRKIAGLEAELEATRQERNTLSEEKAALEGRVEELEAEVQRLKSVQAGEA